MRSWFSRSILVVLVLVGAFATVRAAAPDALFVVVGDQHSAYDRTAQLIARVDQLKAENPGVPLAVLIDGDTFELGNVVARRTSGAIEFSMFAALAQRAPTVLNLGNHEPEFYDLAETVARAQAAGITVIGNVVNHDTGALFAPASTRLRLGALDIVVAGITTDLLAQYRAAVRPTLDLANPAVWAREKLPQLLDTANPQPPLRIVLSHAGLKYDRQMFDFIPDGTLFAGAHDHIRFGHRLGRTLYFHSGSWNSHLSIVRLTREAAGPRWDLEQPALTDSDPADPALAEIIRSTREKILTAADRVAIGHRPTPLARAEAARWVVSVVRRAVGADAAFIGNTTFGDGLPGGDVTRMALDSCVRFDGHLCIAEVSGAELRTLLRASNQNERTPFAQRLDESLVAEGPALALIAPAQRYRIVTTDWGMKNRARYFGNEALVFTERPELRLKAIVAQALKP